MSAEFPYITCVCPTYNRPTTGYQWLLEETIQSFLNQDYAGAKELLILNDTPGQTLECEAPGVRIINLPTRISSLGEKYNLMLAMAEGTHIAPFEDDDINLPWRLSVSVEHLQKLREDINPNTTYFNPGAYFALPYRDGSPQGLETHFPNGVGHNCSLFSREAWRTVGFYPRNSGAQDMYMDQKLKQINPPECYKAIERDEWFYIYRWGVQPHHLSGRAPHDEHWQDVGRLPIEKGHFVLQPQWRRDYVQLVNQSLGWTTHPQMA